MNFNPEVYKRTRWILWTPVLMLWLFAFTLIEDAFNSRADFKVIIGSVTEEGYKKIKGIRNNYSTVYYFKLSTHKQLLGIGTDINRIPILDKTFKRLRVGDSVKVTFEENWATKTELVNELVHEIVREDKVLYDNIPNTIWNGRMKLSLICFVIGLIAMTVLLLLHRKYIHVTKNINARIL